MSETPNQPLRRELSPSVVFSLIGAAMVAVALLELTNIWMPQICDPSETRARQMQNHGTELAQRHKVMQQHRLGNEVRCQPLGAELALGHRGR
jgi:hypothetical protein